jgi:quercetin dioxygenase-like cupin family protein
LRHADFDTEATKGNDMKKWLLAGSMLTTLVALMTFAGAGLIRAEDGTPTPAAEIKREALTQGQSAVAPDRTLLLQRRTFAPGSDSGVHPAPGPVSLYVDSGTIEFTVTEGSALVTRAGATEQETIDAGETVTLNAGDAVFYDQGVQHQVVNTSAEPAVTLEARLNPTDQGASTPAPATAEAATTIVSIDSFMFNP